MKKIMGVLGAVALAILATVTVALGPAAATPDLTLGVCNSGWYVNPDETTRKPTPTPGGLKFEANQLIHHGATGSIEGLAAGSFVAVPAPDQPSFFSVEVRNADGTGYATLRWNTTTSKWNMVAAGTLFEHESAAELVKMTTPHKSSFLMSFGVGYTNSPPGTVAAVVISISFKGATYDMKCLPPSSSSSSASGSPSANASSTSKPPSATASATSQASAQTAIPTPSEPYYENCSAVDDAVGHWLLETDPGYRLDLDGNADGVACEGLGAPTGGKIGGLPLTGTSLPLVAGVGGSLVLAGAAVLVWLWRRNRTEFRA